MSETDIIEDAPEQEPVEAPVEETASASDRIEYVLPCAHTHRGKTYQKGDTLMLRADQIQRIEGNLTKDAVSTETGGDN